jgi:hypothetical protein
MAGIPPTQSTRDANLQTLLSNVQTWGQKEQQRLDNETKFLTAVLQGQTAAMTGTTNLATASSLLESSINDFINIGGGTALEPVI